jgi:hypothetical protein
VEACNFGCCDRQTRVVGECWCLACQAWHYHLCWTHCCIMLNRWGRGGCPLFAMQYLDIGDCKVGGAFGQRAPVGTKQQPMWQPSSVLQHLPAAEQTRGCMPHKLLHARILMLVSRCRAIKLSGSDETVSQCHHLPHILPCCRCLYMLGYSLIQSNRCYKAAGSLIAMAQSSILYILLRDDRADSNST